MKLDPSSKEAFVYHYSHYHAGIVHLSMKLTLGSKGWLDRKQPFHGCIQSPLVVYDNIKILSINA